MSDPSAWVPSSSAVRNVRLELALERQESVGRRAVERGLMTARELDEWLLRARENGMDRTLEEHLAAIGRIGANGISSAAATKGPTMPPAATASIRLPSQYELVEEIGRGAMGAIWKARDRDLNRWVAVKCMQAGAPASLRQRFLREAQAAARVRHPNIVTVHAVGDSPDGPYIVMEFIEGRTLQFKGALNASLDTLRKVARALHEAHALGVVHRDLKPANVVVDGQGTPHVVDFGLAKVDDAGSHITHTGAIVGTPLYMAPEQAVGDDSRVGPLTDVYALGAMLYEALAGHPPFNGRNAAELFREISLNDPAIPPGPPDLAAIALKALQKDPRRRYPSAAAFADDLDRYLAGHPVSARLPGWPRRLGRLLIRRRGVLAAATALLALIGILIVWQTSSRNARMELQNLSADYDKMSRRDLLKKELSRALQPIEERIRIADRCLYTRIDHAPPELSDLRRSLEEFETRANLYGGLSDYWKVLGHGWYLVGNLLRSEHALLESEKLDPGDGVVNARLGRLLLERALYSRVISMLGWTPPSGVRDLIRSAVVRFERLDAHWQGLSVQDRALASACRALAEDRLEESRRICNETLLTFTSSKHGTEEFLALIGWIRWQEREPQAAAEFDKALDIRPCFPRALVLRGVYRMMVRQDAAAAQADFDRALALDPDYAAGYFFRGLLWGTKKGAGKVEAGKAIVEFDEVIRRREWPAEAHAGRGYAKAIAGDLEGGVADLREAQRLCPSSSTLHMLLGNLLMDKDWPVRDFASARDCYTKAIELNSGSDEAFLRRAVVEFHMKQYDACISDSTHSLELNAANLDAYYYRAQALLDRGAPGDHDAAERDIAAVCGKTSEKDSIRIKVERLRRRLDR